MTVQKKSLLVELLRAIIREWGREGVSHALDELAVQGSLNRVGGFEEDAITSDRSQRASKRPSAKQQVAKLSHQPDARREILIIIATRYDEKKFLPSVGDVREFLAMNGDKRQPIKDRSEGFRLFLDSTKEFPLEQLRHLATSTSFSGPSQLAPLSDAISASGEARRQQRTLSQTDSETAQSHPSESADGTKAAEAK